jgi:hypothetical protein
MLHVIAQNFGRHRQPVFLSGVPSVRGFFIGGVPPSSSGGAAAVAHSPTSLLNAIVMAFSGRTATGCEPAPAQGGPGEPRSDEQPHAEERLYSDYEIAYQTGYEGFMKYGEKTGGFEAVEPSLREEYEHRLPQPESERPLGTATALAAAKEHLLWDQARHAAKTAWKRAAKQLSPRHCYRPTA